MLDQDSKWASVSLRIFGDNLRPEDIGPRLNLEPRRTARKGEPFTTSPRSARHKTNLWMWWLSVDDSVPLEQQVELALDVLEPKRSEICHLIDDYQVQAELFLGFSSGNGQGGAFFSVELLERLARLGLPVEFDLYPPDVDELQG